VSQGCDCEMLLDHDAIGGLGQWKRWILQRHTGDPNMPTTKIKPQTKSAKVIALLGRAKGASLEEICKATNWQPHSARAFLTGLRKKGLVLAREQGSDGGTVYRMISHPCGEDASS